ncbi:MAG: type IV pilus modification PilV family protein [Planctomycetota bacterium]
MTNRHRYRGFSLTEVLLAVGTLAVGMIFISGTFLTGIHLSTIATERTIAAVAADEAFAKIRIYGIGMTDPNFASNQLTRFEVLNPIAQTEFAYPSTNTRTGKQYYWSALCRPVLSDPTNRLVQVTVLVSRKVGSGTTYRSGTSRPVPVQVAVSPASGPGNGSRLAITNPAEQTFINGGSTLVDNQTGLLYRVLKRDPDAPNAVVLDKSWQSGAAGSVWVVPPPVGGGKYPCVAVYQRVISF